MKDATEAQIARAFAEWERRYRDNPDHFLSEAAKLQKETPQAYGDAAAGFFLLLLERVRLADRAGEIADRLDPIGILAGAPALAAQQEQMPHSEGGV